MISIFFIDVIEELDSKQRKIRSFRGFFLYALEITQNAQDYQILQTNFQPFFWKKVPNIIRQNKKGALQEFLFGSTYGRGEVYTILDTSSSPALQELQNQVDSLQQKVIQLETRVEQNSKDLLTHSSYFVSEPSQPLESSKTTQQGNYTLNSNMGSLPKKSFQENDINFHQDQEASFKSFSETSKIDFKPLSDSQQYNLSLNQEKELNQYNFITLGKISEADKIEIIQLGFQLQSQAKISLKKYYESTDPNSLFQLKGYSIKYETIRRTKLYQQLKI